MPANNKNDVDPYPKPIRANDDDSTSTQILGDQPDLTKANKDGGPEVTPTRHLMEEELFANGGPSPRRRATSAFDHDGDGKEGGSRKRAAPEPTK